MATRTGGRHITRREQDPHSPKPSTDQAEVRRSDEEVERIERQSRSDEQSGQDRIDRKGIDAPATDIERQMHAPPLKENG